MSDLTDRIEAVERRIQQACQRAGRERSEVTLVAVTKGQSIEAIRSAYQYGLRIFGESYVQEWEEKYPQLPDDIEWHFIGGIQSNKARFLADGPCACVHSVGRAKVARKLSSRCDSNPERTQPLPVFLEVNLGDEESKAGVDEESVRRLLETVDQLPAIRAVGLMAIPPQGTPEETRPWFAQLRQLAERLSSGRETDEQLAFLSMGMSADFEVAIEEGATHIRVGTAMMGPRS